MFNVRTTRSPFAVQKDARFALCPECGQKLFDVRSVAGSAELRIKCRRCRNYIQVSVSDGR